MLAKFVPWAKHDRQRKTFSPLYIAKKVFKIKKKKIYIVNYYN